MRRHYVTCSTTVAFTDHTSVPHPSVHPHGNTPCRLSAALRRLILTNRSRRSSPPLKMAPFTLPVATSSSRTSLYPRVPLRIPVYAIRHTTPLLAAHPYLLDPATALSNSHISIHYTCVHRSWGLCTATSHTGSPTEQIRSNRNDTDSQIGRVITSIRNHIQNLFHLVAAQEVLSPEIAQAIIPVRARAAPGVAQSTPHIMSTKRTGVFTGNIAARVMQIIRAYIADIHCHHCSGCRYSGI